MVEHYDGGFEEPNALLNFLVIGFAVVVSGLIFLKGLQHLGKGKQEEISMNAA